MTTIQQVQKYNKSNVDWDRFFSVVDSIGSTMNGKKDRFEKSDIIEMSLGIWSRDGAIKYVNYDGVDHILVNLPDSSGNPTTQEMKFVGGSFYKEYVVERANKKHGIISVKKICDTKKPINLKLVNSMGSNSHKTLSTNYAKFLLVIDNHSAHVIKVSTLVPYLKFDGDGIKACNVPCNLFYKIVGPEDVKERKPLAGFNYKEKKLKLQYDYIIAHA